MIAQTNVVIDGQFYKKGDEIWDLGSFECVSSEGNIRHYEGLSSDSPKLPHYVNTGSSALALDTLQVYKFHKPTDTWHELEAFNGSEGGGGESVDYNQLINRPVLNNVTFEGNLTLDQLGIAEIPSEDGEIDDTD